MGLRSMLGDIGVTVRIRVSTGASAAKGIASRRGLGKVRHIEVHQLWAPDKVASGEGKANIADVLTTHIIAEDIRVHIMTPATRRPKAFSLCVLRLYHSRLPCRVGLRTSFQMALKICKNLGLEIPCRGIRLIKNENENGK